MRDLIERLEKAEAGSRELDAEICVLLQYGGLNSEGATDVRVDPEWGLDDLIYEIGDEECCCPIPNLTTSLDAAHALAERELPFWAIDISTWGPMNRVTLNQCDDDWWHRSKHRRIETQAATPALALVAAILRAKDAQ